MSSALGGGRVQLDRAREVVEGRTGIRPRVGIVLGSGLGAFATRLRGALVLPYAEIPGFPTAQVAGHAGNLCLGRLGETSVACMQGRVHAYEGHSAGQVVFGVRLLAALGCRAVLLSNAAGGIRDDLRTGDLMLIADHINLSGQNPLVGETGGAFVDMNDAYDPNLRGLARHAAEDLNLALKEGTYAGVLGPSYETPAEVRMLRALGADAVGMSTVQEVIALRALGVRVGALSAITNRAAGLSTDALDHADVQKSARDLEPAFVELLGRWVALLGEESAHG